MAAIFDSSSDLRADRRYAYALACLAEGDGAVAADLLLQVLEIAPDWIPAWFALGQARHCLGDGEAARQAFDRAVTLDPDDRLGASLHLQRLGERMLRPSLPAAYVRHLFDQYADRFEAHLGETLAYRAPRLVRAALKAARPAGRLSPRLARALDLGCGTGMAARALTGFYDRICGVDLSPRMISKAACSGLYDALVEADILAFLEADDDARFDLVIACDVFVYFGDLHRPMAGVAHRLAPGALFAFSVQSSADGEAAAAGFDLGQDLRFAHAGAHVRAAAASAGLVTLLAEAAVLRKDRGEDVHGAIYVLQMGAACGAVNSPLGGR
jgi:predicted TPR repeat methyltransferase